MNIEKVVITDKLAELGLNMSHKGFEYLVDAVLMPSGVKQMSVYRAVASMHNVSATQVERCIRTCVETYYADHVRVPQMFMPYVASGKLPVGDFVHRARQYAWRNTGMLEDGTYWALFDIDESNCVVRFYTDKGNYDVHKGSRPQCVVYLKNLLKGVG